MSSEQPCEVLDKTWNLVRDSIAQCLLGNELIPVPDLTNANHFGLFSIFVKHQPDSIGQKLKSSLTSSSYHVIGHISQVIQLNKTDLNRLLNSANPHIEDNNKTKKVQHTSAFSLMSVLMSMPFLYLRSSGRKRWISETGLFALLLKD